VVVVVVLVVPLVEAVAVVLVVHVGHLPLSLHFDPRRLRHPDDFDGDLSSVLLQLPTPPRGSEVETRAELQVEVQVGRRERRVELQVELQAERGEPRVKLLAARRVEGMVEGKAERSGSNSGDGNLAR